MVPNIRSRFGAAYPHNSSPRARYQGMAAPALFIGDRWEADQSHAGIEGQASSSFTHLSRLHSVNWGATDREESEKWWWGLAPDLEPPLHFTSVFFRATS